MASTNLLVEDNPNDAELILRTRSKNRVGNTLDLVTDGAEALDYLFATGAHADRAADDPPDLILLDLKLPKIDGREVLRRLREEERTRTIPVVVLTSSDEAEDIDECYKRGANSYVRKTVIFEEFVEAVNRLGLYWMVTNTPPRH